MGKNTVAQVAGILSGVAVAVSCVTAQAAPTVYGRLDVSVRNVDVDTGSTSDDDNWKVDSYASRLGFKGSEDLSNNLSAIYQYEVGVNPSDSTSSVFSSRVQFVGLKGDFGTIRLGRLDTPTKTSQGKFDQFNDHSIDLGGVIEGDNRPTDTINYVSPKIADAVTFQLSLIQGEAATDFDGDGDTSNDNGLGDATSASIVYSAQGIYAALGLDSGVDYRDTTRVTLGYNMDGLMIGGIFQTSEGVEDSLGLSEESAIGLSVGFKVGDGVKLKGQYVSAEDETTAGTKISDTDTIGLGIEKSYSKTAMVYAEYTMRSIDYGTSEADTDILGVGIRKIF